jgi:methyl-accepting chemotaxis protein
MSKQLNETDKQLIRQIADLSSRISNKLGSLGTLREESVGNIAHHLAEVCLSGRSIDSRIVPALLATPVSEAEMLAELSHDLMSELNEIRDGIEEMSADVVALMSSLNR